MRDLSHLVDKRVRATGEIVNIHTRRKRNTLQYELVLTNVIIDQSNEPIDHIHIYFPVKSVAEETIKGLLNRDNTHITFTAKVHRYTRKYNDMFIRTQDYGLHELRKIEFLERGEAV